MDLSADFSVIIGPQASGKSTLGKIIYFCRKIRDYAIDIIGQDEAFLSTSSEILYTSFIVKLRKIFAETFEHTEYTSAGFQVQYNYDKNDFVLITLGTEGEVNFQFSGDLENKLKNIFEAIVSFNRDQQQKDGNNWNTEIFQKFWQHQLAIQRKLQWFGSMFHDDIDTLYIPAGRGILSILANQILPAAAIANFDTPVRDFIERVQIAKTKFKKGLYKIAEDYANNDKNSTNDINLALSLVKTVLKADYINEADGEKLYIDPVHSMNLIYGSSGQQESLWILLFMFSLILEQKRAFIILEEPEANVYPSAQKDIVKLAALTLNSTKSQIFITTHSPYILTSANVLIQSGRVESNISGISEDVVVPPTLRINPESTTAYKFSEDGLNIKLYSIRDVETGMFEASEIDTISDVIAEETNRLIDLEVKHGL